MSDTTTALAVRRPSALVSGYNPPPSEDEFRGMIFIAKQLAEVQGFVPAHFYKQPNKILAAILYGRDLGITPTNALQHIIVIEGKATADAQLIGMLVRRAGHRLEDKTTEQQSTVTITRGDDGSAHVFTFTMQDAQRAGLVRAGSAWQKFPQAMLYARALTGCARKGAQDALMGVAYVPEELGVEATADGGFTGEIPIEQASAQTRAAMSGASEVTTPSQESTTAIQPTPPTPPEEVPATNGASETVPAAAPPAPPPAAQVNRRGTGRSIGPAPRRVNTITPQTATAPALAPEPPPAPSAPPLAPDGQQGGDLLTEQAPQTDGLEPQRQLLREAAADLAHVNAVVRNLAASLEGKPLEIVPPAGQPGEASDASLQRAIGASYPGATLGTLDAPALQAMLERCEASLAKKREQLAERGIKE